MGIDGQVIYGITDAVKKGHILFAIRIISHHQVALITEEARLRWCVADLYNGFILLQMIGKGQAVTGSIFTFGASCPGAGGAACRPGMVHPHWLPGNYQ